MTITASQPEHAAEADLIVLDGVSWKTYESLLRDFEATGQRKRVTYDRGTMVIVSPLPKHEKWKSLPGRFVEAIADARAIPISTFGSTTWKRRKRRRGLEPDDCFYIQREPAVRGKLDIDLTGDPPPDLAIETDLRLPGVDRMAIYAALEVPEVWCFDGDRIEARLLNASGTYDASQYSAAFPFLRPAELKQFLDMYGQTDQGSIIRLVREWAAKLV